MTLSSLRSLFAKVTSAGFFHIFLTSVLNKVLTFLCAVLVVRILSKTDYGVYSYAWNLLNIALLFNGLGAASAVLQLASESSQQMYRVWVERFGLRFGLVFDCLLCAVMLCVALFSSLPIEGSSLLLALCVAYPMPQFVFELQSVSLRAEFKNKEYAAATNINTFVIVISSVGGAALGGAIGLIVGRNLAVLLSVAVVFLRYRVPRCMYDPACAKPQNAQAEKRDFFKIALVSAANNGLASLTYLVGTFFVGLLLVDANSVASYQAATVIPFALNFIPSALMTFIYPYFARNRSNRIWTFRWFPMVMAITFLVALVVAIPSILLAPHIITLVYGRDYLDAVPSFIVLMIGFTLTSSLRVISGNLLVTQRKLLFNTVTGVGTLGVLVVLCAILIPSFGIVGAAVAQAVSLTLSGVAATLYLVHVYRSLD